MEELVKQAKMGNEEAFTQLIIQMQCEMFRIAQTRLKNIDDANDAIQQTNLYAYKNLRQLKEDKYFKTWIIKILINECNKVYRKNYKILNIFDKLTKEHIWKGYLVHLSMKMQFVLYYFMVVDIRYVRYLKY